MIKACSLTAGVLYVLGYCLLAHHSGRQGEAGVFAGYSFLLAGACLHLALIAVVGSQDDTVE